MLCRGPTVAALLVVIALAMGCGGDRMPSRPAPAPRPTARPLTAPPLTAGSAPASAAPVAKPWTPPNGDLDPARTAVVDRVVRRAIAHGEIPGAVVTIILGGRVVLTKAYGHRRLKPEPEPMTVDALFDLASLTKPMVTATAIMQLVERHALALDARMTELRPSFANHGKGAITVAELLGHTSGLPDSNPLGDYRHGRAEAFARLDALGLTHPPGSRRVYSDLDYIVLGELVASISKESLDDYARRHVFDPLGMASAGYLPDEALRRRAAPTTRRAGQWLSGRVHDMRAEGLAGVAGHAGLFASADDVTRFVLMLLGDGTVGDTRVLSAESVATLLHPHPAAGGRHGLGLQAVDDGYGHTGFTGTSLWLEPKRGSGLVILANRLHPDGDGDAGPLRKELREAVRAFAADPPAAAKPSLASVMTGVDVLVADGLASLRGRRLGLVTNHSGVTRDGRRTVDVLAQSHAVELVALFSPEHGLAGSADAAVADGRDAKTGLPVYSLYGQRQRPTREQLKGIDTLVVDLQAVGTRFYTYVTTLGYLLETCKELGLRLVVLDRPNPLGGVVVEGPTLDPDRESFIGYHPIPVRHGMTVGELAGLFNHERKLGVDLRVVRMRGWRRSMLWSDTDLSWPVPSPNLRTFEQALLYPGVALLEATNVSVGRGTEHPFELLGAPWLDGKRLASALRREALAGVTIEAASFTPAASRHRGQLCHGVRIRVIDGQRVEALRLGVALAHHLLELHPQHFQRQGLLTMLGDAQSFHALERGTVVAEVMATWRSELDAFRARRKHHLLYGDDG